LELIPLEGKLSLSASSQVYSLFMASPSPTVGHQRAVYQRSLKPRPRIEYSSEYFFRPLAHLVVSVLLPLRVPPTALVVFHTCLGIFSGVLIAQGHWIWAAWLIQVKTVLDNADGQLARASGMTSEIGRYADTEGDLLVNAALFWGIGAATGQLWLAVLAFVILTVLLSSDFNLEYLYKRERGEIFRASPDSSRENQFVLGVLAGFYRLFFRPQDVSIRAFADSRFERIFLRFPNAERRQDALLAYHEPGALFVLANLELSTQLAVLGIFLLIGQPGLYLWFVIACGLALALLQWRRERIAIRVLRG
jgi:archaetidylinositol phosphate synthase